MLLHLYLQFLFFSRTDISSELLFATDIYSHILLFISYALASLLDLGYASTVRREAPKSGASTLTSPE